jgi:hypothetical protein
LYTGEEKYLNLDTAYTANTIVIADVTASASFTKGTNMVSGMTDFTGDCYNSPCTPPTPQFLSKPKD